MVHGYKFALEMIAQNVDAMAAVMRSLQNIPGPLVIYKSS